MARNKSLFFRLHKFDWNDQWYQELYNIRGQYQNDMAVHEHLKLNIPKYTNMNTIHNQNSVIVGHNEYSRNQFATALDVSGNVDVSGNITVTGNVTIPGDITLDTFELQFQ